MTQDFADFLQRVSLARRIKSFAEELSRPPQQIQDEELRQTSRLLSGLLLTTMVAVTLILVLVIYYDPDDLLDLRTLAGISAIVVSPFFFTLNRMGYTRWAITGFLSYLTLAFLIIPYLGEFPEFLAFTAISMLLAGMFYSFRLTVYWIGLIVGVVFVLNSLYVDTTIWERRNIWYFLLFAGGLTLTFKSHLNRLENIRSRRLDEANAQLRATINALPDLLFEVDRYGRFVSYHAPDTSYAYIPEGGFVGRTVSEIFPKPAAKDLMKALDKAGETGKSLGTVFWLDLPVGRRWFEVSISSKEHVVPVNNDARFVAVARDITERKQAEALQAERKRLEVELQKEKELAQIRSQLISIIAHEFRTPLTVISISGSLLVQYEGQLSSEQKAEKIETILEEVKRLDEMLDDVSTLSKAQRNFLVFQPELSNIVTFCESLINGLKSLARPNQKLEFRVNGDIKSILFDPRLLQHALTNLVSNALKYSPNGGIVTVQLAQTNNNIVVKVSDDGIGIPSEDIPRLFSPFFRASNVGFIHGTGLGLSIVKAIVDLHEGHIVCHSQENIGTTFEISLPVRGQTESS